MEMEYTSMAASIERRLSHQSSEDGSLPEGTTSVKCPICDVTEMQADKGNVCVECERFVCHSCGSFEMSQNTKVRKYIFVNLEVFKPMVFLQCWCESIFLYVPTYHVRN